MLDGKDYYFALGLVREVVDQVAIFAGHKLPYTLDCLWASRIRKPGEILQGLKDRIANLSAACGFSARMKSPISEMSASACDVKRSFMNRSGETLLQCLCRLRILGASPVPNPEVPRVDARDRLARDHYRQRPS